MKQLLCMGKIPSNFKLIIIQVANVISSINLIFWTEPRVYASFVIIEPIDERRNSNTRTFHILFPATIACLRTVRQNML